MDHSSSLFSVQRTVSKPFLSRMSDFISARSFVETLIISAFILILPETNNSGAVKMSERIRYAVEKERVFIGGLGNKRITVSIGVSTYPHDAETLMELVQNANKALCQAKELGKNLVESM